MAETYNQTRAERDTARRLAHQDLVEMHPAQFRLLYQARLQQVRSGQYVASPTPAQRRRGARGHFLPAGEHPEEYQDMGEQPADVQSTTT
ncbi:MAG: hypothetical protein ACLGIS_10940 [Actinomycetes bacterium]